MTRQNPTAKRSGIATMWLILSGPVMILILCAIIEIGNLWLARNELVKGLEAASLAAVKVWGSGGSTADARDAAISLAAANTVRGVAITLARNENLANPNGNASCPGSIVLGGLSPAGSGAFDAAASVGCGRSLTARVDLSVMTQGPGMGGFGTTFNDPNVFVIDFKNTPMPPTGLTITSITYDLQACGDDGVFQPGPASPTVDTDGYGPVTGTISGTIGPPTYSTTSTTVTVTFPSSGAGTFDPGEVFKFGVDTDNVGTPNNANIDRGGRFGVLPGMSSIDPGIQITIQFSNGSSVVMPKLMRQGPNNSSLIGNLINVIIPDADFAARTQATVSVPSICPLFGSYTVTAKADAAFRCPSGPPRLVRFTSFSCN